MPETNTATDNKTADNKPVLIAEIERNGAKIPFYENAKKRGDDKGTSYPCPDKKWWMAHAKEVTDFLTEQEILAQAFSRFKQWCQQWADENTDEETGVFKLDGFIGDVKEMSARGETIAELMKANMELTLELAECDSSTPEGMKEAMDIAKKIQANAKAIASKKREKKPAEVQAAATTAGVAKVA